MDGRGNRLEMACERLRRHGIEIAILTETKLVEYHTTFQYGYKITATKCENQHQGGVALLSKKQSTWHIESIKKHGQNIIQGTLVHGEKRTNLVGVYIPPSDEKMETIQQLDKVMKNERYDDTIILGDMNVRMPCIEGVTEELGYQWGSGETCERQ